MSVSGLRARRTRSPAADRFVDYGAWGMESMRTVLLRGVGRAVHSTARHLYWQIRALSSWIAPIHASFSSLVTLGLLAVSTTDAQQAFSDVGASNHSPEKMGISAVYPHPQEWFDFRRPSWPRGSRLGLGDGKVASESFITPRGMDGPRG